MNASENELMNNNTKKLQSPFLFSFLFGLIILITGGVLFFINENQIVDKRKVIIQNTAEVINAPLNKILPQNEGKLIYLTGPVIVNDPLVDKDFNIEVNAVHLKRNVETYQWIEKIESVTEKTRKKYSYFKEWKSGLINYLSFNDTTGHVNPKTIPYSSKWLIADKVMLGAYELSNIFLNKITNEEPLNLENFEQKKEISDISYNKNRIFIGKGNEQAPEVGDLRIIYTIIKPQVVSIIGKQKKEKIVTYTKKNKSKINLLETGIVPIKKMFLEEKHSISKYNWFLRIAGAILLFLGFLLISPYLQNIDQLRNIFINSRLFASFLLWLLVFSLIVTFVWIMYAIITGIIFLALALLVILFIVIKVKKCI